MHLAIATQEDFRAMWRLYRLAQRFEQAQGDTLRERRAATALAHRMVQSSGAFMRVVMGCELVIKHACDPNEEHYALAPLLKRAPDMRDALALAAQSLQQHGRHAPGCPASEHPGDDPGDFCSCGLQQRQQELDRLVSEVGSL